MSKTINARLDDESEELLERLQQDLGQNASEVVRSALKALAAVTPRSAGERVVGIGQFTSGVSDLGSNKKHLKGFGR